MEKLHLVVSRRGVDPQTENFLYRACQKRGVEFVLVEAENYDFSKMYRIKNTDGMYRTTESERSIKLAKIILDSQCVTFLSSPMSLYEFNDVERSLEATILHQKLKLPIIKTVFDVTADRALLKSYANYLGGFPIILKDLGACSGVGVMKLESFQSLASVADNLTARGTVANYIMRQYIDYEEQARLIVLDNQVIDSLAYRKVRGDFRSNVGDRVVNAKKFSPAIEAIAVKAVKALGLEFGGVDILVTKTQKYYLAEVNFPCPFYRNQMITGKDIALRLVDYLDAKSKQKDRLRIKVPLSPAKPLEHIRPPVPTSQKGTSPRSPVDKKPASRSAV